MAQYYAYAQGSKQKTHRLGGKSSGAEAGARGWNVGGRVVMLWDEKKNCDVVTLYLTSGSSGGYPDEVIGHFILGKDGEYIKI